LKGIACDVNNYRPISLTCIACKVMERIIVQRMLIYLKTNNIIARQQQGFSARRSTTSNILNSRNDWTLAINNKNFVTVACVDYSKAFDVVCHSKRMRKLQHYGRPAQLDWQLHIRLNTAHKGRVSTLRPGVLELKCSSGKLHRPTALHSLYQ
jgi:Reverse transcriptase (RNA-dependent DNA polymerase)